MARETWYSSSVARRMLVAGTVSALAATTFAVGSAEASSAECEALELPLPADVDRYNSVTVIDADPTGRYVVGRTEYGLPDGWGLLWVDGELEAVLNGGTSDNSTTSFVRAVNSSGVVVGDNSSPDGDTAWTYQDGEYTTLEGATAVDINDNGTVLGRDSDTGKTLVWSADDPAHPRQLLGNVIGTAISDEGIVVGVHWTVADGQTPRYWPDVDSGPQKLALPANVETGTAQRIAGEWVSGSAGGPNNAGLRWNLADGTVERLPYDSAPVNRDGDYSTYDTIYRSDGSEVRLQAPAGSDATPLVTNISDAGSEYVAAGHYRAGRSDRPLAWTC